MTFDYHFHVNAKTAGERLDKFLSHALLSHMPTLTRTRLKTLITAGDVHIAHAPFEEPKDSQNDINSESSEDSDQTHCEDTLSYKGNPLDLEFSSCTQPSRKVKTGDVIALSIPDVEEALPLPEAMDLDIVFEDGDVVVVNKQAGLVVHPGAGNPQGTLINGLLHHCGSSLSGIGGVARPGIVHRLDKGTSGLMVVAKNDQAHQFLSNQFTDRSIKRTYFALCWGIPNPPEGQIKGNIGRDPRHRQRMKVLGYGGKEAITNYFTHEKVGLYAGLIECNLETGRTHQIRVHMTHKGCSLIGDPLYGRTPRGVDTETKEAVTTHCNEGQRPMLHAGRLSFIHPKTSEVMTFEADLPPDFEAMYTYLKSNT